MKTKMQVGNCMAITMVTPSQSCTELKVNREMMRLKNKTFDGVYLTSSE
jgi:hypothetical protein